MELLPEASSRVPTSLSSFSRILTCPLFTNTPRPLSTSPLSVPSASPFLLQPSSLPIPQSNESYGTQTYWDERYSREAEDASFDWFKKYEDLKPLINRFVPDKTGRVCMLGCGNSTLSRDMYDDGYTKIENIDYSSVVIDKMAKLNEARIGMNWMVGDVRALPFEDGSIDVCIDKGTMDAMMTVKGDVWNPPPEVVAACKGEIDEVTRVLSPNGVFLYLTWGQPHFRKPHLKREGWDLEVIELGEGFSYYFYILRRSGTAPPKAE